MAGTYQCYQCGQRVDESEVHRVTVMTGKYARRWVNMCATCADRQQRRTMIVNLLIMAVVVTAIAYAVLSNVVKF